MFSTILSILQIGMPVILWILDKFRVSKETKEAFIKKVQSAKDDGQVAIQQRDEFKRQDEELKQHGQSTGDPKEEPANQP